MNRQANYIIYGVLLSLTLPIGYFFVDKISSTAFVKQDQSEVIDTEKKASAPVMSESVILGKTLFNNKCAACHQIFKDATGPSFLGLEERGSWSDRQKLYSWIRNPAAFMKNDNYTKGLKEKFGSIMPGFPDLSNEEIDAIVDYINYAGASHDY